MFEVLGESLADIEVNLPDLQPVDTWSEVVGKVVEHVAAGAGVAISSMGIHAAFDVVLHVLTDSHACKSGVVVDACMSVGDVDDAACLDGVGSREDVAVDDFGIGCGLGDEIEVQELVTADAVVVDVEIDGDAAVGELLEANFDEFFGVDLPVVVHSLFCQRYG